MHNLGEERSVGSIHFELGVSGKEVGYKSCSGHQRYEI